MGLEKILDARSVAVIGASRDERKRGYQAVRALCDGRYEGKIYPINPREEIICGLKCYPSILDVPDPVDLALLVTPASTIPDIVADCGAKGVAGVVIIAGGFGELGADGRKLQEKLSKVAKEHNVRIIGPNTSGMINAWMKLNLVGLSGVPQGEIALLSQSGNMALHLITEAELKSHSGFTYYVGVGNEADIKFHEYLEFFTTDPKTRAILMYVEGLSEGREFLQQAHRTTSQKPIVLLKGGRSTKGRKSAGSHTGALAGISEVAKTAFERAGIINIENSDELFPVTETVANLPPVVNNRIAILADGGGHATIAADVLTEHGVQIPELKKATRKKLAAILSPNATLNNPIDVAGSTDEDPGVFADCAKILLEEEQIGGLLIVGLFGGYGIRFAEKLRFIEEDAAHRMGKLVRRTNKPIIVHSLYNSTKSHSLELLRYYGITVYDSVDIACKCMAVLSQYGQHLATHHHHASFVFNWGAKATSEGQKIIAGARAEGRKVLLEHEAKKLLSMHGASVSADRLAATADEAVAFASKIKGKVALKIVSPDILHKSEAGGVKLGLEGDQDVRKAFDKIVSSARKYKADADIRGCLVSPMATRGAEVIVGTKLDDQFGPVIMFGIGGVLVEVLKDVSFAVLPISRTTANKLITRIKSAPILAGFRGKPPVDKTAIADLLMAVSEVVESYPEIHEMDLNPVIVRKKGLTVVDARIILKHDH